MQSVTSDSIYTEGVLLAFQKQLTKISTGKKKKASLQLHFLKNTAYYQHRRKLLSETLNI